MRDNLPAGAVRVEDAPCGCERYQFDSFDAEGHKMPNAGTVALHKAECPYGKRTPSPDRDWEMYPGEGAPPKRRVRSTK